MNEGFGIPSHGEHPHTPHRAPARFLVLIDAAGTSIARLFDAGRLQVAEFNGGAEEVTQMTDGLQVDGDASGSDWSGPLAGHTAAERAAAKVFTLDV